MKRYILTDTEFDADYNFTGDEGDRSERAYKTHSADLMEIYSYDPSKKVRMELCRNPEVPFEILQRLASDPDWEVRQSIAIQPHTPVELLEQLAQDSADAVRIMVAANRNTPADLLDELAKDINFSVAGTAVRNPNYGNYA